METLIHLSDESLPKVTLIDEWGGKIERMVTLEELYKLFKSSQVKVTEDKTEWKETPILPERCVRFAQGEEGEYKVLIHVPAQNHDMWLLDERIHNVAFPALLFGFVVNNEVVVRKKLVAVKAEILTDDTELYRYPYSNVYNSGEVCWKDLPQITELRQLGTMPELFLGCPDNLDLWSKGNTVKGNLEYRELLEQNQGKRFPNDLLVKRRDSLVEFWNGL